MRTVTTLPCRYLLPIALGVLGITDTFGQCPAGELEVTIQVQTDNYGNETMWQLVTTGAGCNNAPIFQGGNAAIACNEAGTETSPAGGYADNTTINEGPFCLVDGASYDIVSIDSYGDGQAGFTVLVEGGFAAAFPAGSGGSNTYTFMVELPPARDMAVLSSHTSLYGEAGLPVVVAATVQNVGSEAVTGFEIAYSINGGTEVTQTITANLAPGAQREVELTTPWLPSEAGTNNLAIRINAVNGQDDLNSENDEVTASLVTNPAIPDLADLYLEAIPTLTVVADADQDILVPRDLDFHPDRTRNELWVVNKDVFATGGSTVKFTNPGETDQDFLYQRDPAARHFLSLPTGIAMGDNNCFSTSPGIWDANGNQSTTTPFTGITLWSADPAIYAQNLFGPLGSHLDMLHVTPRSQGIAHDRWNKYWVVDGHNQDVVMHDFKGDHGPGQDYHGNAIIHRYPQVSITRDPGEHIVSHCVLDKHTGWLYVVDHGGQRVWRLDTRTGTLASGNPSWGPFESYVQYETMQNATAEVIISGGLQQPSGIDVVGSTLLVSDHGSGEIILYDMANGFAERGRIAVGAGVMGIKVGPDGRIWFVNATSSTLTRIDPANVNIGIAETAQATWSLHPNPANTQVYIAAPVGATAKSLIVVRDGAGRLVKQALLGTLTQGLEVRDLPNGVYTVSVDGSAAKRLIIAR